MKEINDFRIPKESEYNAEVETTMRSNRSYILKDNKLISHKNYEIGGQVYSVNSIFDMSSKRTAEDNLKYLMLKEIEKVS
ncbi:MAG: hypothetical protein UH239_09245 [Acutalibacteraceae bacterium]|uniref:hypothetical protein n=1 Tax=Ruminococcus sp. TaxID=41978 RepID=UPI002E76F1FE|nr:hypothetical protein [Ruminococcus sp.]MEE1057414.1 hypothetical protein [Acutalibacteraceae bacterium]MEE1263745.1 hypothetical protein [Ruminococcus sp.]